MNAKLAETDQALSAERQHYDFLCAKPNEQWAIKYLYDRLNIIDNKTSAVLRFNGVIIGFVSVVVFKSEEIRQVIDGIYIYVLCTMTVIPLAFAEFISLRIFRLKFDRIGGINDEQKRQSFDQYKSNFFKTTIKREELLSTSLSLTFFGFCCFLLLFAASASALVYEWYNVPQSINQNASKCCTADTIPHRPLPAAEPKSSAPTPKVPEEE